MIDNTGGPAFPAIHIDGRDGMSLRDYFAANALTAIIQTDYRKHWPDAASEAYKYADAMMKERSK